MVFKYLLFTLGRMSFHSFSSRPLLFLLLAHKSHHLLPPLSSHCSVPLLAGQLAGAPGAAEPARPSGPTSTWRSSAGPQNLALPLRKPPRGGFLLPRALLLAPARQLRPRFCPHGRAFPCGSCLGRNPPSRAYKSPTRGP
jgi:hypothetical protein